jgi:hypothetical protein
MARRYQIPDYMVAARKQRTVKTRDKYNITGAEAIALDNDISRNSTARDWGMSARMVDALIDRHRKGNAAMKRVVEDQLDDINYHREARALSEGKYKDALKMNQQYHKEMGTKPTKQYQQMYKGLVGG